MKCELWVRLLDIAIIVVGLLVIAAVPGAVALFFGFAWGLLIALAVFGGLYWLASRIDMGGGFGLLVFGTLAALIGLIVGTAWRLLS